MCVASAYLPVRLYVEKFRAALAFVSEKIDFVRDIVGDVKSLVGEEFVDVLGVCGVLSPVVDALHLKGKFGFAYGVVQLLDPFGVLLRKDTCGQY